MNESCAFCDRKEWEWRSIHESDLFVSFVSNPRFRSGHCLVIPRRHIEAARELRENEAGAIMLELGRLSAKLDGGFGSGMMQKFQPTQIENGIKMDHLHFHVFPRTTAESGLFPVPEPNDFTGFSEAPRGEVIQLAERLK